MEHAVFNEDALISLGEAYPAAPRRLAHSLANHPLLKIEALASLAARMRPASLEHNAATGLRLGLGNHEIPDNGLSVAETIEQIDVCGSWVLLKTIDQDPSYAQLMREVLREIVPIVAPATGAMMQLEGFIFISSPGAITPPHFDPEYNILFQARGSKTMTLYPPGDPEIISDTFFEQYFSGGPRNLPWRDEWAARGQAISIAPGEAIYVPLLAPHWVQTHDEVSISLSLTWRSEWSFHHADACRFNRRLRRIGLSPRSVAIYPANNRLKSYAQRALARVDRVLARDHPP